MSSSPPQLTSEPPSGVKRPIALTTGNLLPPNPQDSSVPITRPTPKPAKDRAGRLTLPPIKTGKGRRRVHRKTRRHSRRRR